MFTEQEISKLTELVLSEDLNNQKLALTIAEGQKVDLIQIIKKEFLIDQLIQMAFSGDRKKIDRAIHITNFLGNSLEEILEKTPVMQWIKENNSHYSSATQVVKYGMDLGITNLQLSVIPAELGELKFLKKVFFNHNQLTKVSKGFFNATNIEFLKLNNNQLTELPKEIGQLSLLKNLYLHNNKFSTLPEGITKLKKLRSLYLANNQLTHLPDNFNELQSLRILHLNNNQITKFPEILENMTISSIHLLGNPIEKNSVPEKLKNIIKWQ